MELCTIHDTDLYTIGSASSCKMGVNFFLFTFKVAFGYGRRQALYVHEGKALHWRAKNSCACAVLKSGLTQIVVRAA